MRRKSVQRLSDILPQVLAANHMDVPLAEMQVVRVWPEVVGRLAARYTSQVEVRSGVLYVTVTSAPLRHELFMSREHLLNQLNKQVGRQVVSSIVLR